MEPARDSQHVPSMLECLKGAGHESASSQAPSVSPLQDDGNAIASPEESKADDAFQTHSNGDTRSDVSEGTDTEQKTPNADEESISKEVVETFLTEKPRAWLALKVTFALAGARFFGAAIYLMVFAYHLIGPESEEPVFKLLKSEGGKPLVTEVLTAQGDKIYEEIQGLDENDLIKVLWELSDRLQLRGIRTRRIKDALRSLPEELRYTLQTIPKKDFRLSQEQDTSVPNQCEGSVEDSTQQKRMLEPGESRLLWQTGGEENWVEISSEQLEAVEILLDLLDDVPKSPPLCVGEPKTTPRSSMKLGTKFIMIAGVVSLVYWLM